MKRFQLLACVVAVALWAVLSPGVSVAQQVTHGNTEFSVMHGLVIASSNGIGDDATIIMTPVPPVWRVTFWTQSPLTIETGFSLLSASAGGNTFTILNLEGGLGANLATHNAKTVPFVGAVGGVVAISMTNEESQTDPYVGVQLGLRTFVRDYAALRVQTGFRHVFVKHGGGTDLFEAVAGLSFFL